MPLCPLRLLFTGCLIAMGSLLWSVGEAYQVQTSFKVIATNPDSTAASYQVKDRLTVVSVSATDSAVAMPIADVNEDDKSTVSGRNSSSGGRRGYSPGWARHQAEIIKQSRISSSKNFQPSAEVVPRAFDYTPPRLGLVKPVWSSTSDRVADYLPVKVKPSLTQSYVEPVAIQSQAPQHFFSRQGIFSQLSYQVVEQTTSFELSCQTSQQPVVSFRDRLKISCTEAESSYHSTAPIPSTSQPAITDYEPNAFTGWELLFMIFKNIAAVLLYFYP